MSVSSSNLGQACLRTFDRVHGDDAGWIERAVFDRALAEDEWAVRNPHRLARLNFTLAGMSEEGLLELQGYQYIRRA